MLQDLKPLAEKKAITVQAEDLVDVPVRADRHKLEQVFLNLVHNALKFTPERGHLIVRSDVTKDHVSRSPSPIPAVGFHASITKKCLKSFIAPPRRSMKARASGSRSPGSWSNSKAAPSRLKASQAMGAGSLCHCLRRERC